MEAGTNEFNQRLFAPVEQRRCCATFGGNRKVIDLYHDKDIGMLKLGCIMPNLAKICFPKSTAANFYPFVEGWRNFEKMLLLIHLSFLHKNQFTMTIIFENQQTYANLLYGLTLANFSPSHVSAPADRSLY